MKTIPRSGLKFAVIVLVCGSVVGWAAPVPKEAATPSGKLRQALDQPGDVVFEGKTLVELTAYFKSKLKAEVVYDNSTIAMMGIDPNAPLFTVKVREGKIRDGLKASLASANLTYGIVGNTVFIGTEETVIHAQMRQRVSVDAEPTSLPTLLKSLAGESGANIVLDPRIDEKANKAIVKLKLDDVALETAVRLSVEVTGFATIRMGNVLFVTSEERADKLRAVSDGPTPVTLPNANLPIVGGAAVDVAPAKPGM